MKKLILTVALAAFVGGISTASFAQDGEKKTNTTKKTEKKSCDKKKSCCKKTCDKKKTESNNTEKK